MTNEAARAEIPELMCTTVPPAKSRVPMLPSHPPLPQTQCANGSYTNVAHNKVKTIKVENFIRSAKVPVIRAGVMIANMS